MKAFFFTDIFTNRRKYVSDIYSVYNFYVTSIDTIDRKVCLAGIFQCTYIFHGIKVKIPSEIKPPLMKTQTYKFIIQLHKNVFPKPNVKISMHATKHYKLHVIWVTVTARQFTKHKRKAIVIRLLNIKD